MLADIIHACSEVMRGMLNGEQLETWDGDTGAFIVNDSERPGKKLRVYFNALDETMLDGDNKAEKEEFFKLLWILWGRCQK